MPGIQPTGFGSEPLAKSALTSKSIDRQSSKGTWLRGIRRTSSLVKESDESERGLLEAVHLRLPRCEIFDCFACHERGAGGRAESYRYSVKCALKQKNIR